MKEDRRVCEAEGCNRGGRNKGFSLGKRRYGRYCEFHTRKLRKGSERFNKSNKAYMDIDNSECSRCGWSESYCDRHRIDPDKGYTKENVIVLCPNCHRVEHHGL